MSGKRCGAARILKLKLEKIKVEPWAMRLSVDNGFIDRLSDDMVERGQENPVKVMRKSRSYILVTGFQRLEAAKKAKMKFIEAEVLAIDKKRAFLTHLAENALRKDLHPMDLSTKIAYGNEVLHISLPRMAKLLGQSEDIVKKLKALHSLPESVKNMVRHRTVDWTKLYELISIKNRAEVNEIAQWILDSNPSIQEIRRRVALVRGEEPEKNEKSPILKPPPCDVCGREREKMSPRGYLCGRDHDLYITWVNILKNYPEDFRPKIMDELLRFAKELGQRQLEAKSR